MTDPKEKDENLPVEGQDFADPKEELNEKHPPKQRDENGSEKDDADKLIG